MLSLCRLSYSPNSSKDADSRKDVLLWGFFDISAYFRRSKFPKSLLLAVLGRE